MTSILNRYRRTESCLGLEISLTLGVPVRAATVTHPGFHLPVVMLTLAGLLGAFSVIVFMSMGGGS